MANFTKARRPASTRRTTGRIVAPTSLDVLGLEDRTAVSWTPPLALPRSMSASRLLDVLGSKRTTHPRPLVERQWSRHTERQESTWRSR